MEERYGVPYIEESFYGVDDMNRCLRNIAAKIGDRSLQERVEKLITEETTALDIALASYRDRLKGKRVVLYTGGVKSWSIISAAKDLGMEVVATSTKKSTEEDKARIKELLGKDGIAMEKGNAQELLRVIAQTKADMLIAGGRNQYTALKARIPFLDINQERHHPYAGYVGMVDKSDIIPMLDMWAWWKWRENWMKLCIVRYGRRCVSRLCGRSLRLLLTETLRERSVTKRQREQRSRGGKLKSKIRTRLLQLIP